MLVVTADDYGLKPELVDPILECWRQQRISAVAAVVHMQSSVTAAELASGMPVGLHLNLTTPFDAPDVPATVAERQARACHYFAARHRRWLPAPRLRSLIADCIADQLSEFERLYGRLPDHADGHENIQCCPTVYASPVLASVRSFRISETYEPGERPAWQRAVREAISAAIRRRFVTTDRFRLMRDLKSQFGGAGFMAWLQQPGNAELAVNPKRPDERQFLLGSEWHATLAALDVGGFADLAAP